ncbi:DUF2269 domain-containing protein [Pseudomonas tremae]|uniref:DUF2269 family protein n=1 Tax=Pseudomonas coronafaciens pv. coronafaciens TaxID=235275 RepID=A0AAE6QKR3_9PSED|nr:MULTISPECIES: DUF2269 domain-containing protein [Pseudomonas syringae group]MCF5715958.1 DUF2269 family protein [Pseudomonas tremae]MCF5744635.1 DUF2269 family protein [Pseudomonas tremae]MCQ2989275.1 DUF2269 domain-containing protein [Pseudomonas tremae]QGT82670.1 DUF2269 family protein [Pseudomonas coronafaciens pv. coronafaciens]QIQ70499.1 hypothetical protein HBB04_00850 [Pseudomonas coronafaciens]
MLYIGLKYLHVIAAIFLFGFGMGSYLYLIAASRSGNPVVIAHVARTVVRFDAWITTPAGFVQIITGYAMARLAGMSLLTDWIITSLIIFVCVGMLWLPVLILQHRLQRMAEDAVKADALINDQFQALYRLWFWLGIAGFSGMFVIVLMMVSKMTFMRLLQI